MLIVHFISLIARYTKRILRENTTREYYNAKKVYKGGLTLTLHRLYRLGEELVANANSRDPFQIADEIGLQIQMVKDFTVLKGVYRMPNIIVWRRLMRWQFYDNEVPPSGGTSFVHLSLVLPTFPSVCPVLR